MSTEPATDFAPTLAVGEVFSRPEGGAVDQLGNATIQKMEANGYATAISVQKPRQLAEVATRVEQEAAILGETAFYGWGAGKNRIEGPSIDLATVIARNWGNCAVAMEPVQDLGDGWVFGAAFVDLESGFTITRQFRQSKQWTVYGKHDPERKADIRFQIGQSKAARNVILNAVPQWLIDAGMKSAKAGVRKRIETFIESKGIEEARRIALASLAKYGVTEERALAKMQDLVIIKGDLKALDDGAETADNLYPLANGNGDTKPGAAGLVDKLKKPAPEPPPEKRKRGRPRKTEAPTESEEAKGARLLRLAIDGYRKTLGEAAVEAVLDRHKVSDLASAGLATLNLIRDDLAKVRPTPEPELGASVTEADLREELELHS
jgi:hypothetical protein